MVRVRLGFGITRRVREGEGAALLGEMQGANTFSFFYSSTVLQVTNSTAPGSRDGADPDDRSTARRGMPHVSTREWGLQAQKVSCPR